MRVIIPSNLSRSDYLLIFSVVNLFVSFLYFTYGAYCTQKLRYKFKRVRTSKLERAYFNMCGYKNNLDRLYSKKKRRYQTFGIIYFGASEVICDLGVDVLFRPALTCSITVCVDAVLLLALLFIIIRNRIIFKNKTDKYNEELKIYKKEYMEFAKEAEESGYVITVEGLYNGEYFVHEDVDGFSDEYDSDNVHGFLEDRLKDTVDLDMPIPKKAGFEVRDGSEVFSDDIDSDNVKEFLEERIKDSVVASRTKRKVDSSENKEEESSEKTE